MSSHATRLRLAICCAAVLVNGLLDGTTAQAQSGMRESLERLDKNGNGEISPDEITPQARPYLERITRSHRLSLDRPNRIDKLQEAARVHHALLNGAAGKRVRTDREPTVLPFGPREDQPLVPEFGLPEIKYPYTEDDVEEAERTLRRSDRNGDGYIDRREAQRAEWTHRDPFEMDLDKDDRLSRMELTQRYARRRLLEGASSELVRKAWRTGNGIRPSKSDEERRSDSWRRDRRYYLTSSVMSRFDQNRNGRLEVNEAAELGITAGRIDVDRDGEISREELHTYLAELQDEAGDGSEGLPSWFYELDADRDQQISMAEYATELTDQKVQEFMALDVNQDGLLTKQEITSSKTMVGGSYLNQTAEVLPPNRTVISELEVTDDYLIGDLNVQISITHTYTSHLDAYLTGPDGQRIELFAQIGGSGDHFEKTILDDQARYPVNKARSPFQGAYMPTALVKRQPSLNHFNGKSVKGVWQLVIRGTRSDRFGMLHSWGIIARPQEGLPAGAAIGPLETGPLSGARSTAGSPSREPQLIGREESAAQKWDKISTKTSNKGIDYEAIGKRFAEAVRAGEMTEEEVRAKWVEIKRGSAKEQKGERGGREEEGRRLFEAVRSGKMSAEEAKAKWAEMQKGSGDRGRRGR